MARGFTDIAIRNLKAGETRLEIPDPGCAGLYVIVQPSGKKSFAVRYRFGKPRKLTLPGGLSLATARKLASDALHDLEKGIDPATAKKETKTKAATAKAETVEWCLQKYLAAKDGGLKIRTVDERKRTFERLVFPEIGSTPLASLKRSHIVNLLDKIQSENGDCMAERTLAYLRAGLRWQAARVDDFNVPIIAGMSRYNSKEHQGTRTLDDDEIRRLWAATEEPQPFHGLVRFLLLTGARRDEAREMTWSEVNGTDWTLPADAPIGRNKIRRDVTRPLSRAAQAVLKSLPVINGGDFIFTTDGKTAISDSKPMTKLRGTCGFKKHWRLHDLRRSARTLLARAGVDSDICERCAGHTIPGIRQIYDRHQYHAEMKRAYAALGGLIERIVAGKSADVVSLRRAR